MAADNREPASPDSVDAFHRYSDVDKSKRSQHHTLGVRPSQASPGSHVHDGSDSNQINYSDLTGSPQLLHGSQSFTGVAANSTVSAIITFPEPLSGAPDVVATVETTAPDQGSCGVSNISATGFTLWFANESGSSVNRNVRWVALNG